MGAAKPDGISQDKWQKYRDYLYTTYDWLRDSDRGAILKVAKTPLPKVAQKTAPSGYPSSIFGPQLDPRIMAPRVITTGAGNRFQINGDGSATPLPAPAPGYGGYGSGPYNTPTGRPPGAVYRGDGTWSYPGGGAIWHFNPMTGERAPRGDRRR